MYKLIGLSFSLFLFIEISFSQVDDANVLKKGIYLTEKEAAKNSPSKTSSFTFTPQYGIIDGRDTVEFCDYLNLNDSTIKRKKIFGFSNGEDIYVRIIEYEETGLITSLLNNLFYHRFFKLNYVGRFSFIKIKPTKKMIVKYKDGEHKINISNLPNDPFFTIEDVWYFDKKGVLRKATEQAFYFLLKDDKDLSKKFAAERHKTSTTYVKYLIEMNDRYKHDFKSGMHSLKF